MKIKSEGSIFDQINLWMESAEEMTAITSHLQGEVSFALSKARGGWSPGAARILPSIHLGHGAVICNGVAIRFGRMKTPLKLFRVFLRRPFHAYTREELVERIYGADAPKLRTDRLTRALQQNLIKLISRTRLIAESSVNSGPVKWIEWFPYDPERNHWSFYRLTNAYLLERQDGLTFVQHQDGAAGSSGAPVEAEERFRAIFPPCEDRRAPF